jgi:hypothetical protein
MLERNIIARRKEIVIIKKSIAKRSEHNPHDYHMFV